MTVLTPFPNRAANTQGFDRNNAAVLRNEINRIVNNALENGAGFYNQFAQVPFGQGPVARNPILTLQNEINRIISLLLQSNPVNQGVSFTQTQAVPSVQPFGVNAGLGQVPFGVAGYGIGQVPFGVNGVGQMPFGIGGYGVTQQPVGVTGTFGGQNANFGAMLLAEINRVFNTVLQDTAWNQQTGFGGLGFNGIAQNPVAFLQNEINRVFNAFLQDDGSFGDNVNGFTPRINLAETTDAVEIEAELPGFTEADIDLAVTGNVVTIKGWRRRNTNETVKDFHITERGYGTFSRSLTLPFEVDAELIRATFNNGVLTVEITKPESVRENTTRIEIAKAS